MTEQVSAFLDGEMDRERLDKNIQKLLSDKQAMQTYRDYQSIGEMMRGQIPNAKPDLTSQIMAKIEIEPTVLSPNAIQAPSSISVSLPKHDIKTIAPAWSIAASVAAVMVVGLFSWQNTPTEQATFAQAGLVAVPSMSVASAKPASQAVTADAIPAYYFEAHRVSAPSVGSHYIQTVNYAE